MRLWIERGRKFWQNKKYMGMLSLTAVLSYGFFVTHQTVGIDDTPYAKYFEEGLAAVVGRWVIFLLNKFFRVSDFSPFITDLAGVLLLMAAVTVWCVLFYSVFEEKIPLWGYVFFACIFLSCPLLGEVYPYYLHNGVSLGYLCTGVSLCFYKEMRERLHQRKQALLLGLGSAALLCAALGCYESFMVVWLSGLCLVLLSERYCGDERKVLPALFCGAGVAVASMVLRSLVLVAITGLFGLDSMQGEAVHRSVTEMAAWMVAPGASAEFAMVLKRIFVMYGVFAYAYYPIRIFVFASVVIWLVGLYQAFRRRDIWCLLLTLGSYVAAFLLVCVEGSATLYRSAQFLPVLCGFGVFPIAYLLRELKGAGEKKGLQKFRKAAGALTIFVLCVILWNQCFDLNKWFYIDWMKYESAKSLAGEIAGRLEKEFDTTKPVVFTGTYQVPRSIIGDAYVPYGSKTFYRMNRITRVVDEHLLEKFYREYGVWVAQTPELSVIDWGRYAFGDDSELIRFFAMHGYELQALTDASLYQTAEEYSVELPHFPADGSIVDRGEYLIVHF